MKLGVIVGHTKKAQGAVAFNGQSEYVWNSKVAEYMQFIAKSKYRNFEVFVEFRDIGGVTGAAQRLAAKGVTHCIELHFNAFTKAAYGCEVLVLADDTLSTTHADLLTDALNKKYAFKERGVSKILGPSFDGDGILVTKSGMNGFGNLVAVKNAGIKVRLLIEPTFMNIKTIESEKIINDQMGYADLIIYHFATYEKIQPLENYADLTKEAELSGLIDALRNYKFESNPILATIKPYLLAQFLLETGRGNSELFRRHYNAGGMKFRFDALPKDKTSNVKSIHYNAHDGKDTYAGFDNYVGFLEYYANFIKRSPYIGFEAQAKKGGPAYIEHLKKSGYATDPNYVSKVLSLVEEAQELLGSPKVAVETTKKTEWDWFAFFEKLIMAIFPKK